jgi:hypothetical protein
MINLYMVMIDSGRSGSCSPACYALLFELHENSSTSIERSSLRLENFLIRGACTPNSLAEKLSELISVGFA